MDGVDDTLRQIDATLAACEPNIERAKALAEPERFDLGACYRDLFFEAPSQPLPGPFRRFYASWLMIWRRLAWIFCLEWVPELHPMPTGKGIDVVVDTPVVPMRRGDLPPPDFRD